MMAYTVEEIWQETVYVAYYLHWPLDDILGLAHAARARVIREIGDIHTQISAG